MRAALSTVCFCLLGLLPAGCGSAPQTDLKLGDGPEARKGDTVVVHYTGWLSSGKKFDSSVDRGQPFVFTLGKREVIQGWDEGVAGMKAGGKRKLVIPAEKAYGKEGRPPVIPSNAELTFEIELLEIGYVKSTETAAGEGPEAKEGDTVVVHYTGKLKNGEKFDSSHDRGKPISFVLGEGEVIKGWDLGVAGMKAGGKRTLVISPGLAYGSKGRPPAIAPNSELTFDVELVEIRRAAH